MLKELYKKYKATYKDGLFDLCNHLTLKSITYCFLYYNKDNILSLFGILLLSLLNIKTFIIYHDCCHYSYIPNKYLNIFLGIILGIFVCNPYNWAVNHNTHHKTSSNKENKYEFPYNETIFHTVEQYKKMSNFKIYIYKFFKHPYVFFLIIPIIRFLILMRFNFIRIITKKMYLKTKKTFIVFEQFINNTGIIYMFYMLNLYEILWHWIIAFFITSSLGLLLFHSQHCFNPSYIVNNDNWNIIDNKNIRNIRNINGY